MQKGIEIVSHFFKMQLATILTANIYLNAKNKTTEHHRNALSFDDDVDDIRHTCAHYVRHSFILSESKKPKKRRKLCDESDFRDIYLSQSKPLIWMAIARLMGWLACHYTAYKSLIINIDVFRFYFKQIFWHFMLLLRLFVSHQ